MVKDHMKELVRNECNHPDSVFGSAFFEQHILVVRDYASRLSEQLGADPEILEIASYLHDISAIRDINALPNHHVLSAEFAESVLMGEKYDARKIEIVKKAILNHSKPVAIEDGSPEEVCLSNADAISQIINPAYWLYYVFSVRKMSFEQGLEWYRQKIDSNWNNLIQQGRDLIREDYERVRKVISGR